jgi:PPOX class probable F420-dependent enzyme
VPRMTPAETAAFLNTDRVLMRIATVRADGAPAVTPSWYLHEHGRIVFTPRTGSAWLADVGRDPRVCLCIDEDPLPYRKVVVDGVAEVLHPPGEDEVWRPVYRRIAGRYMDHDEAAVERYIELTIDQPRALLAVRLDRARVRSWRMAVGDEESTGMWHQRYYAPGSNLAGSSS